MGVFQTERDFRDIDFGRAECGNCTFWNNLSDIHGECRRYPPATTDDVMEDGKTPRSQFPVTSHRHWCGEFMHWKSIPWETQE